MWQSIFKWGFLKIVCMYLRLLLSNVIDDVHDIIIDDPVRPCIEPKSIPDWDYTSLEGLVPFMHSQPEGIFSNFHLHGHQETNQCEIIWDEEWAILLAFCHIQHHDMWHALGYLKLFTCGWPRSCLQRLYFIIIWQIEQYEVVAWWDLLTVKRKVEFKEMCAKDMMVWSNGAWKFSVLLEFIVGNSWA